MQRLSEPKPGLEAPPTGKRKDDMMLETSAGVSKDVYLKASGQKQILHGKVSRKLNVLLYTVDKQANFDL